MNVSMYPGWVRNTPWGSFPVAGGSLEQRLQLTRGRYFLTASLPETFTFPKRPYWTQGVEWNWRKSVQFVKNLGLNIWTQSCKMPAACKYCGTGMMRTTSDPKQVETTRKGQWRCLPAARRRATRLLAPVCPVQGVAAAVCAPPR